uniref:Uncharacterized protein MANES_13G135000 n=1 Tax=Rhizophora mucronata TaxID=61149 RepID=A0A2P2M3M9_RHIMU
MEGNCPLELAVIVVRLIDSCLHKNPVDRPVMVEIVPILSRILSASLTWEMSSNVSGYKSFSRNF